MKTRKVASIVCAFALLGLSPSNAYVLQDYAKPVPGDVMVACLDDTSDTTTYNSVAWQSLSTGRADTDAVSIWVGVIGEDGTTTFGVNSVSVDAVAMQEVGDEDGTGLMNAAVYRHNSGAPAVSTSYVKNAAQVNVSVTFSEAITGAAVCVFTFKGTEISGAGVPTMGFAVDDDTASGVLVLTLAATSVYAGKMVFGVCGADSTAQTTTWAVITEAVETSNAEFSYSAATYVVPDGSSLNAPAITCDYSGGGDASGAASNSGP
jgi:hypothetical protein